MPPINPQELPQCSENVYKQVVLTILEALRDLGARENESSRTSDGVPTQDAFSDSMLVDETFQSEGAESFERFETRVKNFDKELRNFANATRLLGSSVGMLSSAYRLRHSLSLILFLFRENAAELFPRKVKKNPRYMTDIRTQRKSHPSNTSGARKGVLNTQLGDAPLERDIDLEHFPTLFRHLAKELGGFLQRVNEFPEFSDEVINSSILAFEGDLNYWASTLSDFEGQLYYPTVERYVHELASEMGEHLDNITQSLVIFVEVGVPTIRVVQKERVSSILNLTSVATFFSAVTTTALQFSFASTSTQLEQAVNTLWFSSLVFSVASAVNSLLGLLWNQSLYRSPRHLVPLWVHILLKRAPLIFLVISAVTFSTGLVLFAWASNQLSLYHLLRPPLKSTKSHTTSVITTVFTGFSSFGLISLSVWFALERWVYTRHAGQRWLADVLEEGFENLKRATGVEWLTKRAPEYMKKATWVISFAMRRLLYPLCATVSLSIGGARRRLGGSSSGANEAGNDGEREIPESTLPYSQADILEQTNTVPGAYPTQPHKDIAFKNESLVTWAESEKTYIPSPIVEGTYLDTNAVTGATASPPLSHGKHHSQHAVHLALMPEERGSRARRDSLLGSAQSSRTARIASTLKSLQVAQAINVHQSPVRHLQFSPDGKWLATCSWDRTSHLFRISPNAEEPCSLYRRLLHPTTPAGQVAWSSDGTYLLTKLTEAIKVWTVDGICKATIERGRPVQSVAWILTQNWEEPAFMSLERSTVCTINILGNVLATYELDRLELYNVAVTPDAKRFLGVASLIESKDRLRPAKARPEHRIIVYNFEKKSIESQVPILNEVRDITIGCEDGSLALVSYENMASPQLWALREIRDSVRLSLINTYMPLKPVLWAGTSYFGGTDDQLVLCAEKGGDVYMWDRQSAQLLHTMHTQDALSGDLMSIAWNPRSPNIFMLATGAHEGIVKVWTSAILPLGEESDDPHDHDKHV